MCSAPSEDAATVTPQYMEINWGWMGEEELLHEEESHKNLRSIFYNDLYL